MAKRRISGSHGRRILAFGSKIRSFDLLLDVATQMIVALCVSVHDDVNTVRVFEENQSKEKHLVFLAVGGF